MEDVSLNELVADLDINDEEAIAKICEIFNVSEEAIIMTIMAEDQATDPLITFRRQR